MIIRVFTKLNKVLTDTYAINASDEPGVGRQTSAAESMKAPAKKHRQQNNPREPEIGIYHGNGFCLGKNRKGYRRIPDKPVQTESIFAGWDLLQLVEQRRP
jgi:hypothetical protein